jgi:Uma2 family endonuclease
MASATQTQTQARPPSQSGIVPYRLTVRQFEKMIDADVFRDEDHVELLDGILVDKMVKKPPHNVAVGSLAAELRGLLTAGWFVNEEKPIQLSRWSRPEPDVAVIRGRLKDYGQKGPTAVDVGIVGEVADSSYAKDRGLKWRKYAAAKIAVYWIVNLPLRQIEVYTAPAGRGRSAAYRDVTIHGANEEVPVVLEGRELGRIKVRDILP